MTKAPSSLAGSELWNSAKRAWNEGSAGDSVGAGAGAAGTLIRPAIG